MEFNYLGMTSITNHISACEFLWIIIQMKNRLHLIFYTKLVMAVFSLAVALNVDVQNGLFERDSLRFATA